MSMSDAISTISQIQATLTQLNTGASRTAATTTAAAPNAATSAASATASAAFAQSLAAAGAPALPATPDLSGAALPSGTATGAAIANDARKYLGVPYVWGGTDPKTGLDCSGLVQRVYKDLGIDLPRIAVDQGRAGTAVPNVAAAQPGDLLVMNGGQHIGIFMGNNQYIHAPAPGQSVRIENIPAGAVFDKIARIIPNAPAAPAAPAGADLLSTLQAALATGRAA
jgi:cell wall-associated NlpC family hydrolase